MKTWAHLDGTTVREIISLDDATVPGKDLYTEAFAVGLVDVTTVSPQPLAGWTTTDGGRTFAPPPVVPAVPLQTVQASLSADIDRQAEAQRERYITDGSGQAMVYLQKQTQASQALTGLAATPPMTADQGNAAFVLLAAEIGITADPTTRAPAADVFGVARAVAATVQLWLPIAAAIENTRLRTKAAIATATNAEDAQKAHDLASWPA